MEDATRPSDDTPAAEGPMIDDASATTPSWFPDAVGTPQTPETPASDAPPEAVPLVIDAQLTPVEEAGDSLQAAQRSLAEAAAAAVAFGPIGEAAPDAAAYETDVTGEPVVAAHDAETPAQPEGSEIATETVGAPASADPVPGATTVDDEAAGAVAILAGAEVLVAAGAEGEPTAAASLDDMVGQLRDGADEPVPDEATSEEGEAADSDTTAEETGESADADGPVDTTTDDAGAPYAESTPVASEDLAYRGMSSRVPFWIYAGVWVAFCGAMTYLMWPMSTQPFVTSIYYAYFVYGGLAMMAVGIVTGIVVFFVVRSGSAPEARVGLLRAVLLRTAASMTFGVFVWWACLYALDMHRIGLIG